MNGDKGSGPAQVLVSNEVGDINAGLWSVVQKQIRTKKAVVGRRSQGLMSIYSGTSSMGLRFATSRDKIL